MVDVGSTAVAPIYVSDTEDNSDVAVRGLRRPKYTIHESKIILPVITVVNEDDSSSDEQAQQLASTVPSRLPTSPAQSRRSNYTSSSTTTTSKSRTSSSSSSSTPSSRRVKLSSSQTSSSAASAAASSRASPVHIDVTNLADDEDPVLEKELEEIAIHGGRSGMIGGTPGKAAFDVEYGKRRGGRASRLSGSLNFGRVQVANNRPEDPSALTFVEDDADKSWHGPLPGEQPKKKWTKKRWALLVCVLALICILVGVLVGVLSNNNDPQPDDPLTSQQQQVQNIISGITADKTMSDPNTPQFLARQWLLYEDNEVWKATDEGVIQRYALAVFHFATGAGDAWEENNWLIGPECGNDEREIWFGLNCSPEGEVRALVLGTWTSI